MQLDDEHIRRIADHAYKHALEGRHGRFNTEKYGTPMNVYSIDDLARKIKESLASDRLLHFERADGGNVIRDPDNNLTIAFRSDQDGTCYRAPQKERDFDRLLRNEQKSRRDRGLMPARVEQRALHDRSKTINEHFKDTSKKEARERARARYEEAVERDRKRRNENDLSRSRNKT